MRSERKKEIQEQLENNKKPKNEGNGFFKTVGIIYILITTAFLSMVWWIDVLPEKYFYGLLGGTFFLSILILPSMFNKKGKVGRKIFSTIIALLLMFVFSIGSWYLLDTMQFLDKITNIGKVVTEDYVVVVKENATYENIKELDGEIIGTYLTEDLVYSEAKAVLQEEINVDYNYEENYEKLFNKLKNNEYKGIFLGKGSYESYLTGEKKLAKGTKVLHVVGVEKEQGENTKGVDVKNKPFNIFISGIDARGAINESSRTDVNMIATVNPVTHKVLLTSIPRDYYINLPTKGAKDKLTHSGIYGIQETIGAVEDCLAIDINYYLRVNYSTVTKLVDAIGGIQVDSPNDFYTSGMGSLNGHHFVKGINKLDGRAALAFCRERHSFIDGDMQRNENQQLVMKGILEKATSSTEVLTSYTSLLEAVEKNMETNMKPDDMTKIVKEQLRKMPSWKIEKQGIRGVSGFDFCYALGANASIVTQNPEENTKATDNIIKVMREKK